MNALPPIASTASHSLEKARLEEARRVAASATSDRGDGQPVANDMAGLKQVAKQFESLFYGQLTNVAVYFQAGVAFGDRLPYGTAGHIKITATAADIEHASVGGEAPGDATDQLMIRPVGPMSLAQASTIP